MGRKVGLLMQVTLPVIISGIATKVDGSIKISIETRELPATQAADLFSLRNQEAWCLLAPEGVDTAVLPDEKPDASLGTKTPSQRLRNVLYVYWQQHGKQGDFESFYKSKMEQIIEQLKEKLDE